MNAAGLDRLKALQHPCGGFASDVTSPRGRDIDCNGFDAAMVLRLLRAWPSTPTWNCIRVRALDWLWGCRSAHVPGAFAFWPEHARPAWASAVPADVDDTAIMLTELLRYARIERGDVLRSVCKAIIPCRVLPTDATMLPPWVVPGSFFTWIKQDGVASTPRKRPVNVVDCCVNVNVVALISQLGARHLPGYAAAVETVLNGLTWARGDARRLSSLTPFYPAIGSLTEAMAHAIELGAEELNEAYEQLTKLAPDVAHASAGCCRSAYGRTVWHSPAIDLARELAGSPMH